MNHSNSGIAAHVSAPLRGWERIRRWLLAAAGIGCVGLAALGVVLPGLQTTIFLIAACYLFARSCPRLEQLLVRNRFFAAFQQYLDGRHPMPARAKLVTLLIMWSCVAISTWWLIGAGQVSTWIASLVPIAAIVGTTCVIRQGSRSKQLPPGN